MNRKYTCLILFLLAVLFPNVPCFAVTDLATSTPAPTAEPVPSPTVEAEITDDFFLRTELQVEPQGDLEVGMVWEVYDTSGAVSDYHRSPKEQLFMPVGKDYTHLRIGILAHRNNAFRQNAAIGTVDSPSGLSVLWSVSTQPVSENRMTSSGEEWTGQPIISKWSVQVREATNMQEDKRNKKALKEVIIPGADGKLWFLDLEDGLQTRDTINPEAQVIGTPCLAPGGYPYLIIQTKIFSETSNQEKTGLRQYNLYTQEEFAPISEIQAVSLTSSPLFDRRSDTVVTAGENGFLYLICLNSTFEYRNAFLSVHPSVVSLKTSVFGMESSPAAVLSSAAVYNKYVFYADLTGILSCVDTDTLSPFWYADTGDAVIAAIALDMPEENRLELYTANTLLNRESGTAQIRKYNALNGKEIWCREIDVEKAPENEMLSGCIASPVIGEGKLSDLVYCTVTGLSEEGCGMLNAAEGTRSAILALDKETGTVTWFREWSDACVSSPVAVYDEEENGWIIQCTRDGTILMLDGLTGEQTASLSVEGEILSSPAVYRNILVLRTTAETTGTIYGIRID